MIDDEIKEIEANIDRLKLKKINLLKKQSFDKVLNRVIRMPLTFNNSKMDVQFRIGTSSESNPYENFRITFNKESLRFFVDFMKNFFELTEIEDCCEASSNVLRDEVVQEYGKDFANENVIEIVKKSVPKEKNKPTKTIAVDL